MIYIWINPVVDQMYDRDSLDCFLLRHGYLRVECQGDWGREVREKYKKLVEQTKGPVADVRCPAVEKLLREQYGAGEILIPEIEPILMHCAREISGREALKGKEKIIVTPCQALADLGKEAELPKTRFVSWKAFLEELGERPKARYLSASPIPPGFFKGLECPAVSVTGEDEITDYLRTGKYRTAGMIELLWCKDGCHHGDGVCDLE